MSAQLHRIREGQPIPAANGFLPPRMRGATRIRLTVGIEDGNQPFSAPVKYGAIVDDEITPEEAGALIANAIRQHRGEAAITTDDRDATVAEAWDEGFQQGSSWAQSAWWRVRRPKNPHRANRSEASA